MRRDAIPPVRGPAERFTGEAHVDSRFNGAKGTRVTGAIVRLGAAGRRRREVIRAGDMIWTPPGVKHWHGAASNSALSHAAIIERFDETGSDVDGKGR